MHIKFVKFVCFSIKHLFLTRYANLSYSNDIVQHLLPLLPSIQPWELSAEQTIFAVHYSNEEPAIAFSSILENKKIQKEFGINLKVPVGLRSCVGSYTWRVIPTKYDPLSQNKDVDISLKALSNDTPENERYVSLVFGKFQKYFLLSIFFQARCFVFLCCVTCVVLICCVICVYSGTSITPYACKYLFIICSLLSDAAKSSTIALSEGTLGTQIVSELEAKELWESSVGSHKSTHSDAIMSAVSGQLIFVKESERPNQKSFLKTSLLKRWGGDIVMTGSKKHKTTETINIDGNIIIFTNVPELPISQVIVFHTQEMYM